MKWVAAATLTGSLGFGAYAMLKAPSQHQAAIASYIAPELLEVTAFRSPTCGCCGAWLEHMKAQGFKVNDNITQNMEGVKREHRVPENLASCHTALVGGYVVEGHIPAADVIRLITEQPNVAGIAVPGMPLGSPGMESGNIREPYTVYSFTQSGEITPFQEHST